MGRETSKRKCGRGLREPSLATEEAGRHRLQILGAASRGGQGEREWAICTPAGTSARSPTEGKHSRPVAIKGRKREAEVKRLSAVCGITAFCGQALGTSDNI